MKNYRLNSLIGHFCHLTLIHIQSIHINDDFHYLRARKQCKQNSYTYWHSTILADVIQMKISVYMAFYFIQFSRPNTYYRVTNENMSWIMEAVQDTILLMLQFHKINPSIHNRNSRHQHQMLWMCPQFWRPSWNLHQLGVLVPIVLSVLTTAPGVQYSHFLCISWGNFFYHPYPNLSTTDTTSAISRYHR